jgi:hypothetical protein
VTSDKLEGFNRLANRSKRKASTEGNKENEGKVSRIHPFVIFCNAFRFGFAFRRFLHGGKLGLLLVTSVNSVGSCSIDTRLFMPIA